MDSELRKLFPWFCVLSLLVGVLVVVAFYKDQFREWKDWQRKFIKLEQARAATPEQRAQAAQIPVEVRQIALSGSDLRPGCRTSCATSVRFTI